ncbi:MAG: hypothetical protein J0I06_17680 [Planctomycetes bacterium]|nr:hypothetical protein [Planctomycetota bacterium]
MTRDEPRTPTTPTPAPDRAQREADHQRWADDGGRSPELLPESTRSRPTEMPTRAVYRRTAGRGPSVVPFVPVGA